MRPLAPLFFNFCFLFFYSRLSLPVCRSNVPLIYWQVRYFLSFLSSSFYLILLLRFNLSLDYNAGGKVVNADADFNRDETAQTEVKVNYKPSPSIWI